MAVAKIQLTGEAVNGVMSHMVPKAMMATLSSEVCLGRIRPKVLPQALKASNYVRLIGGALPPASVNRRDKAAASLARMYLNNQLGCCVISGKAHALGLWSGADGGSIVLAIDDEIRRQYIRWCGPGDNGCNITDVLNAMKTEGFTAGGQAYKIDGYVACDWTSQVLTQVIQYILGASTIGINLPGEWTNSAVWDATNSQIVGGHDVTPIDYDERGVYVSSWGRVYLITWRAWMSRKWLEEYYAILSPLWTGDDNVALANGLDMATLRADMQKLSGGQIPDINIIPVPPVNPPPVVPPSPVIDLYPAEALSVGVNVNGTQVSVTGTFSKGSQKTSVSGTATRLPKK